jgi:hypothetical protein
MATMERKLDILAEAMTSHNIYLVQQIAQVKVCTIWSHVFNCRLGAEKE